MKKAVIYLLSAILAAPVLPAFGQDDEKAEKKHRPTRAEKREQRREAARERREASEKRREERRDRRKAAEESK